jgi:hypothetical protein
MLIVQRKEAITMTVFTGGNQFGGGGNELIRIENDPNGSCFKIS